MTKGQDGRTQQQFDSYNKYDSETINFKLLI